LSCKNKSVIGSLPKNKYGIIADSVININCQIKYKHRRSVTMPTTIVDYNRKLISFLEDENYGMSKPQFNHFATMVEGSINIDDSISISKIAENIVKAKDKSCICKFLSRSPWDDRLLNRNRISLLEYHLE